MTVLFYQGYSYIWKYDLLIETWPRRFKIPEVTVHIYMGIEVAEYNKLAALLSQQLMTFDYVNQI